MELKGLGGLFHSLLRIKLISLYDPETREMDEWFDPCVSMDATVARFIPLLRGEIHEKLGKKNNPPSKKKN